MTAETQGGEEKQERYKTEEHKPKLSYPAALATPKPMM